MDRDERARLRAAEDREWFAIRRLERELAEEARELERRLDDCEGHIESAERTVDRDLHGQDPEHPPFWRSRDSEPRRTP